MQIPILVGIMSTLLAADDTVNADELASKFEISKRSVYRYVAMLSEGGVPIESRLGGHLQTYSHLLYGRRISALDFCITKFFVARRSNKVVYSKTHRAETFSRKRHRVEIGTTCGGKFG